MLLFNNKKKLLQQNSVKIDLATSVPSLFAINDVIIIIIIIIYFLRTTSKIPIFLQKVII